MDPEGAVKKVKQKQIEEAGTQWSTRMVERERRWRQVRSKRQKRNGPKLAEMESTNTPGEQGDRLECYKVNWSHTAGGFSKPGRSAALEGTSSSCWTHAHSVVSRQVILSTKNIDTHLGLIKWNQEHVAEHQQVLPSSVSRTVSRGNGWKS